MILNSDFWQTTILERWLCRRNSRVIKQIKKGKFEKRNIFPHMSHTIFPQTWDFMVYGSETMRQGKMFCNFSQVFALFPSVWHKWKMWKLFLSNKLRSFENCGLLAREKLSELCKCRYYPAVRSNLRMKTENKTRIRTLWILYQKNCYSRENSTSYKLNNKSELFISQI